MLQQKLVKAFASILVERTPPKMFFNNSLSGQYHLIQAKTVAARFHFRSARLKLGLGWILTIKSGDCFIYHHHWLAWKKVTTLFNIVALGRSKEPPFSYRKKKKKIDRSERFGILNQVTGDVLIKTFSHRVFTLHYSTTLCRRITRATFWNILFLRLKTFKQWQQMLQISSKKFTMRSHRPCKKVDNVTSLAFS